VRLALTCALLALLITGCGGVAGDDRPDEEATLLLDSRPAAVHAGISLATERGYDEAEGVELEVRRPGASADVARRLDSGRADMALLSLRELARARERGDDLVCVYAVVQPPRLVLCVKRTTLEDRRALVRAAIRGLQRGYAQAQVEPDSAVAAVLAETPSADRGQLSAQLDRVSPSFTAGVRAPGELRPEALRRLAPGLDVDEAFDFDQVGPVRNP